MKILIGDNIKRLRKEKNITQEQLAVAMNITCAAVSKWERGETYPDITLLQPLAYYFGVSLDDLMGYDRAQTEQRINDILSEYAILCRTNPSAAQSLIVNAYNEYPNDYRIMSAYMWNLGGDYADNDKDRLLAHKDEFLNICDKILSGCSDNRLRMDAVNMQGKILWAEGKVSEALELYRNSFPDWFTTVGQKSEQLFAKNTPEFLYWVRKNMYELATFAADKLVKSDFFDDTVCYEEKVKKSEHYGDEMSEMYNKTGEAFFLVIAKTIYGRLENDLKYRFGREEDIIRINKKYNRERERLEKAARTDEALMNMNKF
jgi:transcriptional regulator with XRE-family HTH domain